MEISTGLVPPEGWHFLQGKYVIRGESFDDLAKNVAAHRESNGIFLGDVQGDIHEQLGREYPHLVIKQ